MELLDLLEERIQTLIAEVQALRQDNASMAADVQTLRQDNASMKEELASSLVKIEQLETKEIELLLTKESVEETQNKIQTLIQTVQDTMQN